MSELAGQQVKWIDARLFDQASEAARASARGRKNLNFHPHDDFPAHRLLNAIEPGSYIMPHCHLSPDKDETIVALRGRLAMVIFNADGSVRDTAVLSPGGPCAGIDIPHGVFHTLLALDPGTIMFEAKSGPYAALTAAERAHWAPAEGEAAAAKYFAGLRKLFD
jgi:cupin fold WbuC family metalloprotein